MNHIKDNLKHSMKHLEFVLEQLERDEKIALPVELIDALTAIDKTYVEYCKDIDAEYGEKDGTTYAEQYGPCQEFYIEADDWHDVSVALRKLKASE